MNDNEESVADIEITDVLESIEHVLGKEATFLQSGVTLFTKDGRQSGNAIVIGQSGSTTENKDNPLHAVVVAIWLCESDFGNRFQLTTTEIYDIFELGRESNYEEWKARRYELITREPKPTEAA